MGHQVISLFIGLVLTWIIDWTGLHIPQRKEIRKWGIGKLANWLKGSGSALLCLRPLVLITGKYN